MRWLYSLLLACWALTAAAAQSPSSDSDISLDQSLQRSIVRVWWNRDLMGGSEYFRFAVNGAVIQNILPRFQATYETDAWVYDDSGHVVAYLGPAGSWMDRASLQLMVQTTGGQIMPAKLVGIDEAQGLAVVQSEAGALSPVPAQLKIQWKPHSGFYVASLDAGLSLRGCTLVNAERQAGLAEHRLHFKRLGLGRTGNLLFTRNGEFAGFLTTVLKGPVAIQGSIVNLMTADQIIPSVQNIIRTRAHIKSGWLGLYLRDQQPGAGARGILVRKVVPGGPGAKAGITINDIILKVNDVPAESLSQVVRMIQRSPAGFPLKLDVLRGDKTLQIQPTVGTREELERKPTYLVEVPHKHNNTVRVRRADDAVVMKSRNAIFLGIYASDSTDLPKTRSLVITDVTENTPAAQAGLRKGDVILQVNDMTVQNMEQYMVALIKNLRAPSIVFRCLRNDQEIQKTVSLK